MVGWHHRLDGQVWVSSRNWWWTGKPDVLQSMGSQRFIHFWATELNWTTLVGQNKLYKQEHLLSVMAISTDILQCQPSTNRAVYSWALKLLLGLEDTGQLSRCLHSGMNTHHLSCYGTLSLIFTFYLGSSLALPQSMCLGTSTKFFAYQGWKIYPIHTHTLSTSVAVSRTTVSLFTQFVNTIYWRCPW